MAEPTYDEVLKASLNSKLLLYRQLISSFMIKFLCNVEVKLISNYLNYLKAIKMILKKKFSVESLAIFGSALKGPQIPDSDIDILVRYKETPGLFGFIDLKHYLEIIFGRPVDLVTENALKKTAP